MKWRACIGATTAAATLALPSNGVASITFGADLSATPAAGFQCSTGCTRINTSLPVGAPPLTSPVAGTIIRWRIKTADGPTQGTMAFRVIAPAGAGKFTGAGTDTSRPVPAFGGTYTFSTQLPIQRATTSGSTSSAQTFLQ